MEEIICGEMPEAIINDIDEMIVETRKTFPELAKIENSLQTKLSAGKVSKLHFSVELAQIIRSQKVARKCLRDLYWQRNLALSMLRHGE